MKAISYARYQYPPSVIQQAVWLYLRFNLISRRTLREFRQAAFAQWTAAVAAA